MSADTQEPQGDEFVSSQEIARIAGVRYNTVRVWKKRRIIPTKPDPDHPGRLLYNAAFARERRAKHDAHPKPYPNLVRNRRRW